VQFVAGGNLRTENLRSAQWNKDSVVQTITLCDRLSATCWRRIAERCKTVQLERSERKNLLISKHIAIRNRST
jgi:hypothetical protein